MGRLKFHYFSAVVVVALVLVETFVESQYYLEEPASRPLYVFNSDDVAHPAQPYFPPEEGRAFAGKVHVGNVDDAPGRMFAARTGRANSDEEDDEEDDSRPAPSTLSTTLPEGRIRPLNLPNGFDDKVKKRMKKSRRPKMPLHGDPDPIDELDEEGRKPEARLLWPFSIEITKGNKDKGGWGGPGGYNSYHEWMNSWGGWGGWGNKGWGGWGPISGPYGSWGNHGPAEVHHKHPYGWKPGDLTDEEILNSKHYKKYRKKKKKKIKKLKKKLKFKRLVQKILQKHITYLDKIAPY